MSDKSITDLSWYVSDCTVHVFILHAWQKKYSTVTWIFTAILTKDIYKDHNYTNYIKHYTHKKRCYNVDIFHHSFINTIKFNSDNHEF